MVVGVLAFGIWLCVYFVVGLARSTICGGFAPGNCFSFLVLVSVWRLVYWCNVKVTMLVLGFSCFGVFWD